MDGEKTQLILVIAIIAAIVAGVTFLVVYTKEYTGTVEQRWWYWEKRYTYDVCTRDSDGDESCTEYTRCSAARIGYERPALPPEDMPCRPWWGDREENYVLYLARVRDDGGDVKDVRFVKESWDKFEVGSIVKCDLSVFNVAKKVKVVKQ